MQPGSKSPRSTRTAGRCMRPSLARAWHRRKVNVPGQSRRARPRPTPRASRRRSGPTGEVGAPPRYGEGARGRGKRGAQAGGAARGRAKRVEEPDGGCQEGRPGEGPADRVLPDELDRGRTFGLEEARREERDGRVG